MNNEKLREQFVEDAPQQVDELENVRSLSNYVIDLQKLEEEIAKEETLLKQKKELRKFLQKLFLKLWNQ